MSTAHELDLRPIAAGELFSTLRQAYLQLEAGTRLRAIIDKNPRETYMGFVEAGIPHRITQLTQGEWEWTSTRRAWEPMANGPGVHHVGISPDGRRLFAVDRERTVFMFDVARGRLAETISVNKGTSHLAVHPRSGYVYVCERSTNSMVRLDGETIQLRGRIATGESPNLPAAAEDGSVVILPGRNGVLTIAYDNSEELRCLNLPIGGQPSAATVSHNGGRAYVPDTARNLLVSVELEGGTVLAETPVGDGPSHPIVTPDDRMICVANSRSHDISLVDAQTFQVLATIPSGEAAHQTTLTSDGKLLLVANFFEDSVTIVDLPNRSCVAVLPVGPYPHGLDMAPGDRYAIATHFGDSWVSIIDVREHKVAARVPAGLGSSHTSFSPEGERAYVASSIANTITVLDLNSLEATAQIAAV
jgi:YVTN family beta-propeller protein